MRWGLTSYGRAAGKHNPGRWGSRDLSQSCLSGKGQEGVSAGCGGQASEPVWARGRRFGEGVRCSIGGISSRCSFIGAFPAV